MHEPGHVPTFPGLARLCLRTTREEGGTADSAFTTMDCDETFPIRASPRLVFASPHIRARMMLSDLRKRSRNLVSVSESASERTIPWQRPR